MLCLTPDQIGLADRVAGHRQDAAVRLKRKPKGGQSADYAEGLENNKRGCRGELAGHEFFAAYGLELEWHALKDRVDRSLPDLGTFVDVKTRREPWHKLPVAADDNDSFAYLLIDASDDPVFEIVAWCWGHEAKEKCYLEEPRPDGAAYFVPQDAPFMKDPCELLEEARRKC